jgi:hypothetical protein
MVRNEVKDINLAYLAMALDLSLISIDFGTKSRYPILSRKLSKKQPESTGWW